MKDIGATLGGIRKEHRKLYFLMIGLVAAAVGMLVFSLVTLKISNTTIHVGYADIGSYQGGDFEEIRGSSGYISGRWMEMLTFPALALILGLMHNLIAIKLYRRRGEAAAGVFVAMSIMVIAIAVLVLWRIIGEG